MILHREERRGRSKKNRSRRDFLSVAGAAAFLFLTSTYFMPKSEKIKDEDEDEYIIINGWLLKKGDLNDI